MTNRSVEHWYPTAAYLYVLHQGGPALAWEYLRRNPDYRRDWLHRRRRPDTAHRWGLRLLEGVIQLYPDDDPPPDADAFEFWNVPGRKHLIHDGKRLMLTAQWPGCCVRLTLTPSMADGMAYLYAIRGCTTPCARYRALAAGLDALSTATRARVRRLVRRGDALMRGGYRLLAQLPPFPSH